ncbi:uncharacterized protein MONOS_15588 [Monocercomonoides exilis]|uniref:uncharacterized protein n=1 Tax=Monocercomonoides exilis TaxID=2049356 RepID=UPI00355ABFA1|nr:hypothetical protein MONOS_15588 [Monocercomonoides exilis]|eukprot:MONOS_15588.1-p1 / transcript=MONOS_15588.1 / gene=MONOS_15588 / organism=Monocercomonoides_exilis_PA203 / gene_product=unspecified product / transcript_product=unspecified product / location=Mono_scaffold01281:292-1099(-) / protein_length=211 / sequence_SO=supercontig / SO=protein_coding / is_pseudo=false
MQDTDNTKMFNKLLCELEDCDEEDQKQKIEEMKGVIDGMNEEEFESVFTKEVFDKICRMFEEKKLPAENMILLLKHVGFNNTLKYVTIYGFEESFLKEKIKKMIVEENDEGKNEKRLADLCECYLSLKYECMDLPETVTEISVHCLLKVALSKEENEETQKEVEIALLALSCIELYNDVKNELYANGIKEIIQYHQKCGNLTRLAYHGHC